MNNWPRVTVVLAEMGVLNSSPDDLIAALLKTANNPALSPEEVAGIKDAARKLTRTDAPFYYEPKHRRRGRLVDAACNVLGQGRRIEPEWWALSSGERDDDRVPHEQTRPFVEAYQRFLAETGFKMTSCADTVKNSVDRVIGHTDQIGSFPKDREIHCCSLLDLKTGGESDFHRLQLGGYHPAVVETLGVYPNRYNLYLTDDGKYRLVKRTDRRDIVEFSALARAWWVLHPQGSQE